MVRDGQYYSKDHEWARVEGETVVVGITDFAQKELGDVTYVEMPKVGARVRQFGQIGVIESVKAASDLFSPVAGTVSAVNAALENAPDKVNTAPYDAGWICKLKDCDLAGLHNLMNASQYEATLPK